MGFLLFMKSFLILLRALSINLHPKACQATEGNSGTMRGYDR